MALEFVNPPTLVKPHGYAHAVVAPPGRTVYLSGQLSVDQGGELVAPGDYAGQATQAMLNVAAALEGAGATMKDLVKFSIYVVDLTPEHLDDLLKGLAAAARETGMGATATAMLGVASLSEEGALVEIDGVALVGAGEAS